MVSYTHLMSCAEIKGFFMNKGSIFTTHVNPYEHRYNQLIFMELLWWTLHAHFSRSPGFKYDFVCIPGFETVLKEPKWFCLIPFVFWRWKIDFDTSSMFIMMQNFNPCKFQMTTYSKYAQIQTNDNVFKICTNSNQKNYLTLPWG